MLGDYQLRAYALDELTLYQFISSPSLKGIKSENSTSALLNFFYEHKVGKNPNAFLVASKYYKYVVNKLHQV
jgi:hypothetical protein